MRGLFEAARILPSNKTRFVCKANKTEKARKNAALLGSKGKCQTAGK